jgi:hypothetical protein
MAAVESNQEWILAQYPEGAVTASSFAVRDCAMPQPGESPLRATHRRVSQQHVPVVLSGHSNGFIVAEASNIYLLPP